MNATGYTTDTPLQIVFNALTAARYNLKKLDYDPIIGSVEQMIRSCISLMRKYEAEHGVTVEALPDEAVICPRCGTAVTGYGEITCPECGETFTYV